MADQGVRYVVRIDGINEAKSGLMSMESSAVRTEKSIADLNSSLMSMAGALGVGFGLHELVNFGKDAVQGAADFETAMKRIKFASADLAEGLKNQSFILGEVDKFKIPLQSATDSYGKFLAMLAGSDITGDKVRKLHDELLLIGKVKGLGDGQLDAAVMNLGKMLESGSLDARHFRPLEQQLSGIGAFVARELGITVHQLAILRNKGKMTKIDPQVLLSAIEKQAASLEKFLPESTSTIQSQLNELDTAWLKFKNDLVFDNITELRYLFDTLKEGVAYLKAHEDGIIHFGKAVFTLGEIWLGYKVSMGLVNVALNSYNGFMAGFVGENAAVISATELRTAAIGEQTLAVNALTAALERQMAIQAGGSGLVGYGGMALAGRTGAAAIGAETAVVGGAASIGAIVSASIPVAFGLITSGYIVNTIGSLYSEWYNRNYGTPYSELKNNAQTPDIPSPHMPGALGVGGQSVVYDPLAGKYHLKPAKTKDDANKYKIAPPNDHITGQRVIQYNITIKELNGQKIGTQEVIGTKADTKSTAETLRDIIISIVNDEQIRAGG